MTEDVLIPKMKRIEKKKKKIKVPLINILVILFCTLLITGATFVNIDLRHYILPSTLFSSEKLLYDDFIYSFNIIPQIPIVMLICSMLGKRMAVTSVMLYILAGLFILPIFALGGGIKYVLHYSFGYIFSYIPAVIIAGNLLKKSYSFKNMILATIFGVLTIHIGGILYMIFIALLKHDGWAFISGWISAQSGLKIIYDLIISFICILFGKYINSVLKFVI